MNIQAATPEQMAIACQALGAAITNNAQGIACVDGDGTLGAVVLYDDWTPNAVTVHIYSASPKYMFNPRFIHEIFWFPYVYGTRSVLVGTIQADNEGSLKLAKALGFRETYRVTDGWSDGIDMVIVEMRRQDCRWLKNNLH